MECPGTDVFQLLVAGQLAPEERARVADHAAGCRACHALVDALVTEHGRVQHHGNGVLSIGTVIGGRLRIDEILGVGGMGIVVAATHLELGHRVALKFMRDEMVADPVINERFVREARAVVRLATEHVCKVLDVARLPTGAPYIVMELLRGTDLARTVVGRPLPTTIAVEYVMQACIALAEAHRAGIVHRDLKPANLFVTRRLDGGPLVKVLDFGVAKALFGGDAALTHTRVMMGSPGYMSPEQLESARDVDARTDIWALGVTLYQLLSARLPFTARSQTEMAVKILGEPPAPIDLDPALRAVVLRCLEKPLDRRYRDVAELAAALAPFGGPAGRRISATVTQVASHSAAMGYASTVPAAPTPASHRAMPQPTAASIAAQPLASSLAVAPTPWLPPTPAAAPVAVAPTAWSPSSAPAAPVASPGVAASAPTTLPVVRRSRAWIVVAPLAALAGAAIAVAVMASRDHDPRTSPDPANVAHGEPTGSEATAPRAAATAPLAGATVPSAAVPIDAAVPDDGAAQTASSSEAAPRDAAVRVGHRAPADAATHIVRVHRDAAATPRRPAGAPEAVTTAHPPRATATPPSDAAHGASAPRTPSAATAAASGSATLFDDTPLPDALTPDAIRTALQKVEPKFIECARINQVSERVVATFTASPAGKITSVQLEGPLKSSAFSACLNWTARDNTKLPQTLHGGTLRTPLVFQ